MKKCPYCAEEIQDAAIKCRFCGAIETGRAGANSIAGWEPPAAPPVSAMAIGSLVTGVLWMYWVGSLVALTLGYLARREIDREPSKLAGRGMATAGIILGWIGVGTLALLVLFAVVGGSLGWFEGS